MRTFRFHSGRCAGSTGLGHVLQPSAPCVLQHALPNLTVSAGPPEEGLLTPAGLEARAKSLATPSAQGRRHRWLLTRGTAELVAKRASPTEGGEGVRQPMLISLGPGGPLWDGRGALVGRLVLVACRHGGTVQGPTGNAPGMCPTEVMSKTGVPGTQWGPVHCSVVEQREVYYCKLRAEG